MLSFLQQLFLLFDMFESFANWPSFDKDDINAVSEVLKSGKVNRWVGSKNSEFEKSLCASINAKYAIALANGSLALELALYACGVGEGDEVITSCRTFMASASCAVMRGAKPVVADVDLNSQNITSETVKKCITSRTKAIIAVHHAGFPCDMYSLKALAKEHNLFLIEDCAQAHGAVYNGSPVGSIGDVAAWSFCQDKIVSTGGEGGAVTTNNESLWQKMWEYKDHGKSFFATLNSSSSNQFKWLIETFGTNFRMTEMQAVLGINAYKKLQNWLMLRNRNAKIYSETLSKFPCIRLTEVPENVVHSFYKYYAFVRAEELKDGWDRDKIVSEISSRGVPCFTGTCWNVSAEKAFKDRGWSKSKDELPNAYALKNSSLMFLTHPTLTESDLNNACKIIEDVLSRAQK